MNYKNKLFKVFIQLICGFLFIVSSSEAVQRPCAPLLAPSAETATAPIPRRTLEDDLREGRLQNLADWKTPDGIPLAGQRVRILDRKTGISHEGFITIFASGNPMVLLSATHYRPKASIAGGRPFTPSEIDDENVILLSPTIVTVPTIISPASIPTLENAETSIEVASVGALTSSPLQLRSLVKTLMPTPSATPLDRTALTRADIIAVLRALKADPLTYRSPKPDAIYGVHPGLDRIGPRTAGKIAGAGDIAEFVGIDISKRGESRSEARGFTDVSGNFADVTTGNYLGWFYAFVNRYKMQAERKNKRKDLVSYKVYLSIFPRHLPEHLKHFILAAQTAGAVNFKFGHNLKNLSRPDRIVAYFRSAIQAAAYAEKIDDYCKARALTGDRVPFTYAIGSQSLVSIGIDTSPYTSWRFFVSNVLAEAIELYGTQESESNLDRILLFLRERRINTDDWLPFSAEGDAVRGAFY